MEHRLHQEEVIRVRQRVSSRRLEIAESFTDVLEMRRADLQNMTSSAVKVLYGIQPMTSAITNMPSRGTVMLVVSLEVKNKVPVENKLVSLRWLKIIRLHRLVPMTESHHLQLEEIKGVLLPQQVEGQGHPLQELKKVRQLLMAKEAQVNQNMCRAVLQI